MDSPIWQGDTLGREEEAFALMGFIDSRLEDRSNRGKTVSYVLNLDANWGHGKTFFINRFAKELEKRGHIVATVNAWQSDFSDDPLVAILSSIDNSLQPLLHKSGKLKTVWKGVLGSGATLAASLAKNVAAKAASKYAGDFLDEAADKLDFSLPIATDDNSDPTGVEKGITDAVEKLADSALEKIIKPFRQQERSIGIFKTQLSRLTSENGSELQRRIYILVDELDRCRPSYAIRMLESIKHLFETHGVIFIIATDTTQLSESVKAIYGSNFDAVRYLRRFFDRTYHFRKPDRTMFIKTLLNSLPININKISTPLGTSIDHVCRCYFDAFGISLRDAEQCLDTLATVTSVWDQKVAIQLPHMIGLIVTNHISDRHAYDYICGINVVAPDVLANLDVAIAIARRRANNDQGYVETKMTIKGLIASYRSNMKLPLHKIEPGQEITEQYVGGNIADELHALHGSQYRYDDPPRSVILEYPKYVELAVRFDNYGETASSDK